MGPYQVQEAVGSGGMGDVYRARDTELDRDVAVRVLPQAFASDSARVARFEREKTLAAVSHSNIAHIYGLAHADGDTGIVMELVEGPTLAEKIAGAPIPVQEALGIASQILDALEAAHDCGVGHRDLKPGHIKIKPDGSVKVLDFGVAKALESDGCAETDHDRGRRRARHPGYMSPEQARGKPVDQRADVWAFGCVL